MPDFQGENSTHSVRVKTNIGVYIFNYHWIFAYWDLGKASRIRI